MSHYLKLALALLVCIYAVVSVPADANESTMYSGHINNTPFA